MKEVNSPELLHYSCCYPNCYDCEGQIVAVETLFVSKRRCNSLLTLQET